MTISKGNNKLSAAAAYIQRNVYDALSFADPNIKQSQIDLRRAHLFGKVDVSGNPIILPHKKFLISNGIVTNIPKTDVYIFSFLKPAINDLMDRYGSEGYLNIRGTISQQSTFLSIRPTKGIVFWEDEYESHMSEIRDAFMSFYSSRYNSSDIKNFSDYIKVFETFVAESCPYTVFTLKNFLISRFCDPMVSGMFVNFASDDASDDKSKFDKYILDPNFAKFVSDAAHNGLIVDKHVPWRFAINPNSQEAKEILSNSEYNDFHDFVAKTYIDPTLTGFELFSKMVIDIYRNMVYVEPSYLNQDDQSGSRITVSQREQISVGNCNPLIEAIGPSKSLRLYSYVRMRESDQKMSQSEFNSKVEIAINYHKSLDLSKAIVYIDEMTSELDTKNNKKPNYRM